MTDPHDIDRKSLAGVKKHKTEVERIEREAAQKDAELRTSTVEALVELAQLPGSLVNAPSGSIKDTLLHLEAYEDFEVHSGFEKGFKDFLDSTKGLLGSLYTKTLAQEKRDADLRKLMERAELEENQRINSQAHANS